MTGHEYPNHIASYILTNFGHRRIKIYRELNLGKSIIGKNRRVDLFIYCSASSKAFVVECKYQAKTGTADEKVPYALADMASMPMAGCIVYAGDGFSQGVLHMLQASEIAAYCLPKSGYASSKNTWELDHMLAMHFGWWDVMIGNKKPFAIDKPAPRLPLKRS